MKIEFTMPFRRVPAPMILLAELTPELNFRPPRIARLLALAHKVEGLVRSGSITGYGELARLGHISPARLSQIMVLLHLAPSIQDTFYSSPRPTLDSSASWDCEGSRVNRAGIASVYFSSNFSRISLLSRVSGVTHVVTR